MNRPISLLDAGTSLSELWSPRVVCQVNDHFVKVARVQGAFPWHTHDAEDEFFLVLSGVLTIERSPADGGPIALHPGECLVVPRGMRHGTSASDDTVIALFEPASTLHAGNEITSLARSLPEQLRSL